MCSRRSPWNGSRIVLMNWREQAALVARHTIKPICDRIDAVAPRNAMSRSQIDRLTGRIEALQAQRKPPEQRIFTVLVRNHMRADEEIARFCAEHGVTDSDLLIAQILSRRARAKPQKMPTNASCAPWQETMTMGAKAKRRCRTLLSSNSEWPRLRPDAGGRWRLRSGAGAVREGRHRCRRSGRAIAG